MHLPFFRTSRRHASSTVHRVCNGKPSLKPLVGGLVPSFSNSTLALRDSGCAWASRQSFPRRLIFLVEDIIWLDVSWPSPQCNRFATRFQRSGTSVTPHAGSQHCRCRVPFPSNRFLNMGNVVSGTGLERSDLQMWYLLSSGLVVSLLHHETPHCTDCRNVYVPGWSLLHLGINLHKRKEAHRIYHGPNPWHSFVELRGPAY